jgi:nucleoside-diphosphate-sugar epimerase
VVGGDGFLGVHVVRALRRAGMDVHTTGRREGRGFTRARLDLLRDSEQNIEAVIGAGSPDVIVNCAGSTNGSVAEMVDANVLVPARLLGALARAAPGSRMIHLGSASEYGLVPAGGSVVEDAPAAPESAYGVTKLAGTRMVLRTAADVGLDVVVLRVFNPIGPGAPATSLPGGTLQTIRDAMRRRPHAEIQTGPLDSYRDWIDVRDLGTAVVRAARVRLPAARLYNVAGGRAVCSRDVVQMIADASGFGGGVRESREASSRSAQVPWQQADIARAARDLDWRPSHSVSEAVLALCGHTR